MPTIVAGMHRSGTSLLAGLLNIGGIALGEHADLLPANSENVKGFWENVGFLEFNERILQHYGGTWYDPPQMPDGWLDDEQIIKWRTEAASTVTAQFAGTTGWAWKEPRTSILLPFWMSLVTDARIIICYRNPLDVAASLEKRNGFQTQHGVALWHYYTLASLVDSPHSARILARYESVLHEPIAVLPAIFQFAGVSVDGNAGLWSKVDEFVSRDLEHHQHSLQDLLSHPAVLHATKELYLALLDGDDAEIDRHIKQSKDTFARLRKLTQSHRLYADTVMERNQLRLNLKAANAELDHVKAVLDTRLHRLATSMSRRINQHQGISNVARRLWPHQE